MSELKVRLSSTDKGVVVNVPIRRDNIDELMRVVDRKTFNEWKLKTFVNSSNDSIGFLYPMKEDSGSLSRILLKEGDTLCVSNRGSVYLKN